MTSVLLGKKVDMHSWLNTQPRFLSMPLGIIRLDHSPQSVQELRLVYRV